MRRRGVISEPVICGCHYMEVIIRNLFLVLFFSKTTLSHLCLHVENVKRASQQMLFPEYNCLLLSPANLWQQNVQSFNKDNSLLNTVFLTHVSFDERSTIIRQHFIVQNRFRICKNPRCLPRRCCLGSPFAIPVSNDTPCESVRGSSSTL